MGVLTNLIKVFLSCYVVTTARAATYHAKVADHVNVVSGKFLSFTVDPKYLFSSGEKYGNSQECICMAASLSPAYLRIAGPSTSHLTFHNSTISIHNKYDQTNKDTGTWQRLTNQEKDAKKWGKMLKRKIREIADQKDFANPKILSKTFENIMKNEVLRNVRETDQRTPKKDLQNPKIFETLLRVRQKKVEKVQVTSDEWKRFSLWAKATGFDIVFALNNEDKTKSGLWDPNMALDILSVAEKEAVQNIFWQLGYECTNQSIDEYLNDLETLRVIVDTIPEARRRGWRVVGSDVTSCLQDSSDFKDYVTLSLDMADALMLNGNSSSHELERLSSPERSKLLRLVHNSSIPLWVSESPQELGLSDLERAASWMASLGHSARRGAKVHFKELTERELYRPTLSFYMSLLFKNLVGERVLTVDMESSTAVLFAHCTSLRGRPVPGAVTLYGANMDDEPARLSVKLSKREEGGDIMQFILSEDEDGNIIVNGHKMSQQGDIRPVVRRVRPYKTLLVNLPAKSFGFWVVANTKIDSCQYLEEKNDENLVEAEPIDDDEEKGYRNLRNKRSAAKEDNDIDGPLLEDKPHSRLDEYDVVKTGNVELDKRLENINNYLRIIHKILNKKTTPKVKRQTIDDGQRSRKLKRQLLKIRQDIMKIDGDNKPLLSFVGNLLRFARNGTRKLSHNMLRSSMDRLHKNKNGVRDNKNKVQTDKNDVKRQNINKLETIEQATGGKRVYRTRRSVENDTYENFSNDSGNLGQDIKVEASKQEEDKDTEELTQNLNNAEEVVRNIVELDNRHEVLTDKNSISDNEVEVDTNDSKKIWEVLHNIQSQLKRMTDEKTQKKENIPEDLKSKEIDKILVKTEITDDGAIVNFKEQPNVGWVKSTFENLFHVLHDVNENMNRFWEALSLFE